MDATIVGVAGICILFILIMLEVVITSYSIHYTKLYDVPGLSNAKTVKLTFAAHQGAQDVQTKLLADYAKEVESRSNGKVEINFYPGETLIKAAQTYDGVVNDMVDIGFSCLAYTRGRFPLLDYIIV